MQRWEPVLHVVSLSGNQGFPNFHVPNTWVLRCKGKQQGESYYDAVSTQQLAIIDRTGKQKLVLS